MCALIFLLCSVQPQLVYVPQDNQHILWKILENRVRIDGLRLLQQQTQFDYGHSMSEPVIPEVKILPPSRLGGKLVPQDRTSEMLIDNRFLSIDDALKIRLSLRDIFGIVIENNPDQEEGFRQKRQPWWKKIKADTSADVKLSTDVVRSYKIRFRYLFERSEVYFGFNYFPVREDETVAGFSYSF